MQLDATLSALKPHPATDNDLSVKRKKSLVQPGHRGSGGHTVPPGLRAGQVDAKYAISLFPVLDKLMTRRAGLLSGGSSKCPPSVAPSAATFGAAH